MLIHLYDTEEHEEMFFEEMEKRFLLSHSPEELKSICDITGELFCFVKGQGGGEQS